MPYGLRRTILELVHDVKAAGYMGLKRTWEKANSSPFLWPGMRSDVQRWVRHCQLCQQKKPPAHRKRAKLVTHQVGAPWERMAVDVAGPFPPTKAGNRFILVVQDYFTKWIEIHSMPDQTADTVADFLVNQVFARFGVCLELHSDQGPNFESALIQQVCQLLGIKKDTYYPLPCPWGWHGGEAQ